VSGYLERISAKTLERHEGVVRALIAGTHGVYALYKGDRLYYVGLATDLRRRIRHHLRDKHAGAWDGFSLYLVRYVDHIKELESLILRIADPKGNSHRGRLRRAVDLKPQFRRAVRTQYAQEIVELLGPSRHAPTGARRRARDEAAPSLKPLAPRRIYATYKGRDYQARIRRTGRIQLGRSLYDSPSAAARAVAKGARNGWRFWRIEHDGGLVQLRHHPDAPRSVRR
jgi:hypothetical protein